MTMQVKSNCITPSRSRQTKQIGKETEILDKGEDVEVAYLDFSEKNEYSITEEIVDKAGEIED